MNTHIERRFGKVKFLGDALFTAVLAMIVVTFGTYVMRAPGRLVTVVMTFVVVFVIAFAGFNIAGTSNV